MTIQKLIKWGSSSLLGHICLFELFGSVPYFVVFVMLNYSEGTLTPIWALRIAVVSSLLGIAVALPMWYLITAPILRRRKAR